MEGDIAIVDLVLANVVLVKIEVDGGFQFAGMGTATGELALAPVLHEVGINRQQRPPVTVNAFGVGFEIHPAGSQIQVG